MSSGATGDAPRIDHEPAGQRRGGDLQGPDTGRWPGSVDLGYAGTRRRRKYLSGATRGEVVAKLRQATAARDAGELTAVTERTPTVGEWMQYWVDHIAPARIRPSTLRSYRGYDRNRIIPGRGRLRLDRLQHEQPEAFYREQAAAGLAPATVLQLHRIISRALRIAMRRGRAPRNVATLLDAPSQSRREVEPLTAEEARRVLRTARGSRNAARWSVALALGLRQGDALGLRGTTSTSNWGTLTVRQALQRVQG